MHAVAVVFDLVEPLDRRPAPHRDQLGELWRNPRRQTGRG
jgi:hypothetical protein